MPKSAIRNTHDFPDASSPWEGKSLKILILAHGFRVAGGRATCINILQALAEVDTQNTYHVVVPDQPEYRGLNLERSGWGMQYYRRTLGHLGRWYFDTFQLPWMARQIKPDIIWGMGGLGLRKPHCPQAVSIQNAFVMYSAKHTGKMSPIDRLWLFFLKRNFRKQLPMTQLVFCQTPTMKHRMESVYQYTGSVVVTGKAISPFLSGNTAMSNPLEEFKAEFKLLYVTRYYPHKGLEMLLEVVRQHRDALKGCVIVITLEDTQHPYAAKLLDAIASEGLNDVIVNVGSLKQNELSAYFQACDALLMPTRLESFSGTYLEAMHFGLPILTSDLDFAHEVCGDAAIYFDPWDPASIAEAITSVRNDEGLKKYLVAKGRARLSENFEQSWPVIAENILENLTRICRAPNR